jgi:hypothetical protein
MRRKGNKKKRRNRKQKKTTRVHDESTGRSEQPNAASPFLAPWPSPCSIPLCARLDLGQSLALLETALLLQPQDLEAVEVGEGLPPLVLDTLLVPVAGLPLAIDIGLLPSGLEGTAPCGTGQLGDNDRGQEDIGQGKGLPGNTAGVGLCCGAVNENLQVVLLA